MPMDPSSPYFTLPNEAFWGKAVAKMDPGLLNPQLNSHFKLTPAHKIASAGSCFAQQISESLIADGFNYLVTEKGPSFLSESEQRELGYGVFSARYGNIYSALQLLQLFDRAFGEYHPVEPLWKNSNNRYIDPFRPGVQPDGFESEEECLHDREVHLKAVRELFQNLDVLIFTLGVTESWHSTQDGAAFTVCPGSGLGGKFDPTRHAFQNFSVTDIVNQLDVFLQKLKNINPNAQTILTISPMAIIATFEPRHVLEASIYSKSVLRVACEEIRKKHEQAHYFACYEIMTATGNNHLYFESDKRTPTQAGVQHVMRCFNEQFIDPSLQRAKPSIKTPETQSKENCSTLKKPMCDEETILTMLAAQEAEK